MDIKKSLASLKNALSTISLVEYKSELDKNEKDELYYIAGQIKQNIGWIFTEHIPLIIMRYNKENPENQLPIVVKDTKNIKNKKYTENEEKMLKQYMKIVDDTQNGNSPLSALKRDSVPMLSLNRKYPKEF